MRYPCDKCEYAATSESHLKRYIEIKPEGVSYPCDTFEYAATTSRYLNNILRVNMKKWDIIVIQADSLKQHIMSKHEEVTQGVPKNMRLGRKRGDF